ncbi:MAG TPA: hypothetical protein VFT98_14525 [Myxococcota bacterium]|nr:hypothetical protein [Myxococcota bacterium]
MFGFRGRFGRRRSSSNRPSAIDEAWLRKLTDVLPGGSVTRISCDAVPDTFALLASARDANGAQWIAAVSPRSGLDAALALAVAAARGVAEANASFVAASPDWTGASRRLAGHVRAAGRVIAQAALAPDGDAPDEEAALFVPAERLGAGLASAEARALFERAAEGMRGLAAKHGGALRSAGGELELVIAASAIAALRADGGQPSLELRWPDRSRLALAGGQLADALDRLEGQVRKRLADRDARDGEDGLRARLARAFGAHLAPRFSLLWPYGGAAEAADGVGVADDGAMVVFAAREKLGLAELASVMQAGAALEPVLPALTAPAAPPVRVLDGARIVVAGLNLLPGVEDAAAAIANGPVLMRAGAIEGPFTTVAAPLAARATSPPAAPVVAAAPVATATPLVRAPVAPVAAAEAPRPEGGAHSDFARSEGSRDDEVGADGRRRRRRRGRRRGRGRFGEELRGDEERGDEMRADEAGGNAREEAFGGEPLGERSGDLDDLASDDGAVADEPFAAAPQPGREATPAASEGGFETLSLLDLDEDTANGAEETPPFEARGEESRRGGRRRRRGRGRGQRRGGESAGEGDEDEEPSATPTIGASADDGDDHGEIPELAEVPELGAVDVPRYEDEEEEPESELDRIRHERERRRRERAQSRDGAAAPVSDETSETRIEERGLPRGRVAILAHADRESIVAAVLLAREMRQLEGIWIYPQEDLMNFFRAVATDLRDDTPIYLLGFAARPARDVIQAANLYQGRLVWFDHHEWPPEDVGALRAALGDSYTRVRPGAGSVLPLVLPHCGRRSRFSDKLVDLVTGRFTAHDFQRWGRLWWWRLGQIAAKKGERRAELELLIAGRPSDLAREAERCDVPPPPAEVEWTASRDFRMVHFAGIAMVVADVPAELDLHLCLRIARERFGAMLALGRHEGESTFVLAAEDNAGRRPVDVAGMAEHLAEKFSWVEALPDEDHVARLRVKGLASDPTRLEALIAEIGMGRSILEG